jgi:chromosome segregation ATPase
LLQAKTEDLTRTAAALKQNQTEFDQILSDLNNFSEKLKSKDHDYDLLDSKFKSQALTVLDLEKQLMLLKSQVSQQEEDLSSKKTAYDREKRSNLDSKDEIKSLHEKLRSKETELDKLQVTISQKDSESSSLQEFLAKTDTDLQLSLKTEESLKTQLSQKSEDSDSFRKTIDELKDEESRLTSANRS